MGARFLGEALRPLSSTKAQKCHRPVPLWDFTSQEHMPGGTGQQPVALWDLRDS